MQSELLERAIKFHGQELLIQLEKEQNEEVWKNVKNIETCELECPSKSEREKTLHGKICKFIAQKADMLFKRNEPEVVCLSSQLEEGHFAIMPPIEMFMGTDELSRKKHFYSSLQKGDIVCGKICGKLDSGYLVSLLCLEAGKSRFISDLNIKAFCPLKEVALLSVHEDPIDMYLIKDLVRGVVLIVSEEMERITISLKGESQVPDGQQPLRLGLINEDDLPKSFRMVDEDIVARPYTEVLDQQHGFNNPSNLSSLCSVLGINQDKRLSFMRALHGVAYPEGDFAIPLRKVQSAKSAFKSVADGVTHFKAGRYLEALQHLNKALQIDPDNVEALVARGALYANNSSLFRAIENFEQALQICPLHANARKYLAETLTAQAKELEDDGDKESAIGLYQRALCINPLHEEAKTSFEALQQQMKQSRECKVDDKLPPDTADLKLLTLQSSKEKLKQLLKKEKKEKQKKKMKKSDSKIKPRSEFPETKKDTSSSSSSDDDDSEPRLEARAQSPFSSLSTQIQKSKTEDISVKSIFSESDATVPEKLSAKRSPSIESSSSDDDGERKKLTQSNCSGYTSQGNPKSTPDLQIYQKSYRRHSYSPKSKYSENYGKEKLSSQLNSTSSLASYFKRSRNYDLTDFSKSRKHSRTVQLSQDESCSEAVQTHHLSSGQSSKPSDSFSDPGMSPQKEQQSKHSNPSPPSVRLLDTSYYEDSDKEDLQESLLQQKFQNPSSKHLNYKRLKPVFSDVKKDYRWKTSQERNMHNFKDNRFKSSENFDSNTQRETTERSKSLYRNKHGNKTLASSPSPEVMFLKEKRFVKNFPDDKFSDNNQKMPWFKRSPSWKRKWSSSNSSSEERSSQSSKKFRKSFPCKLSQENPKNVGDSCSKDVDQMSAAGSKEDSAEQEHKESLADMVKFLEMLRSKKKSQMSADKDKA